jgi:hypothetical protein
MTKPSTSHSLSRNRHRCQAALQWLQTCSAAWHSGTPGRTCALLDGRGLCQSTHLASQPLPLKSTKKSRLLSRLTISSHEGSLSASSGA